MKKKLYNKPKQNATNKKSTLSLFSINTNYSIHFAHHPHHHHSH